MFDCTTDGDLNFRFVPSPTDSCWSFIFAQAEQKTKEA